MKPSSEPAEAVDAAIAAANVLMGVAARSVQRVEDEVNSLQLRVLMQAIAIVVIMLAIWALGR